MQHGFDQHGLAGMAVGAAARKLAKDDAAQTPQFGRSAYLAVTDTEVAVLKVKRGAPGGLGEVIARAPKTEVTSAKLGGFMRASLTITFNDGGRWEFEQSQLIRSALAKVVRSLGY
ncbi:MAG TPA: hypothetical protein VFI65_14515 [Streptosporangiaceae bacterium]|nr:hypothetical protein [Streptosporangiaceae bacterium]